MLLFRNTSKIPDQFIKHDDLAKRQHWNAILAGIFVGIVMVIGVTTYLFLGVMNGSLFTVEPGDIAPARSFSAEALEKTIQVLEEKKERYTELVMNPPKVSNPAQ